MFVEQDTTRNWAISFYKDDLQMLKPKRRMVGHIQNTVKILMISVLDN